MPIKKLILSSKNLTIKFITNMNGPARSHIQKSLRVRQERCVYVYFIGEVVWSFFVLIDKFFSFALFSIMKKKAVYSGS